MAESSLIDDAFAARGPQGAATSGTLRNVHPRLLRRAGVALPDPVSSRFLDGPAGRLDARLHGPGNGRPVLLLHPHPQWGGTMGSRLVYDLAVALCAAGRLAVRFDFRGVGRSQGLYAQGIGEADDAAAVFDAIQAETGQVPDVVGYSFGGAVACRLATMRRPGHLVLVATPLRVTESLLIPHTDAARVSSPTHLVLGDHDGFVSVAQAHELAAAFTAPAAVTVVEGAAHFLEPSHNPRAVAAVLSALGETLDPKYR